MTQFFKLSWLEPWGPEIIYISVHVFFSETKIFRGTSREGLGIILWEYPEIAHTETWSALLGYVPFKVSATKDLSWKLKASPLPLFSTIGFSKHRFIEICEGSIFFRFTAHEHIRLQEGEQKSHTAKSYGFRLHPKNSFKWDAVASLVGDRTVCW